MKYLKKFNTHTEYEEAEQNLVLPNVSLCAQENEVHYSPYVPPYAGFCKLTLNDGSTVELEGSGELTPAMTSDYRPTLVSAEIGTQCTSIGERAFIGFSLIRVTIGNGVTSIGASAFRFCSSLSNIIIPNSVTSIGDDAFNGCKSLTSIVIPNRVTSIGDGTFQACSGLTSITIPDDVATIDSNAFASCTSLTSITIPDSVTSIGSNAFYGCTSLSTIMSYIMNAPSVLGGTFLGVSHGGTLYVPIGSSGYETWMNDQGNLGVYNWTKVEQ